MNRKFRLRFVSLVLSAAVLGLAVGVALAQDYPKKPIRFIVPFAAGGGTDIVARVVGEKLGGILGQPVLVENRIGADGRIGTEMLAKAAPDGYTIAMITNLHSISPGLFKKLPYDPVKDFEAITLASSSPNFLLVHPSVPAKSAAELVKLAKSKPGKLNYGASGMGQTPHLNAELFKTIAGIDIMLVAFKGGSEAVTALLGGHLDMAFNSIGPSLPHVKAGTLRALAITSAKRLPLAPDVPTMVECGYPGFVTATWYGVLAPAGTPKQIVTKLNTEIVKILNMPDVRERLLTQGHEPDPTTPEEFAEYIKTEITRWGKVIKDARIPLQ